MNGNAAAAPDLLIHHPDGRTRTLRMDRGEIVLGRDADCDVVLDDPLASRKHARLFRDDDGAVWVEDRRSKNGTTINDEPIAAATLLKEGDRVGIGRCYVTVRSAGGPTVILDERRTFSTSHSVFKATQQLDLSKQRLETLYELNERLSGLFQQDELLQEVVQASIDSLKLDRGGLALWSGDPTPPRWVVFKAQRPDASSEIRISRSLVDRALQSVECILINDAARDMPVPTDSMISNHICSAMVVPLVYHNRVHGVLYGDRITTSGGYGKEDIDFFAALARLAAMGLVNVQLLEERRQREHFESQLQLARQIQNRLFPADPIATRQVYIDAVNDPGRMVSGDYYDYFVRPDGLVTVVIADVSGKGVPAALLMANLQAAVHVTLLEDGDLVRAVGHLNRLICRNVDSDRFITGLIGLLDPVQRVLRYVNVGHPPPFHVFPDGTVRRLPDPSSLPLGVEDTSEFELVDYALGDGASTIFAYTDGVPDAQDDQETPFGEDRLADVLKGCAAEPAREMLTRVRRTLQQYIRHTRQIDDITMVALAVPPRDA